MSAGLTCAVLLAAATVLAQSPAEAPRRVTSLVAAAGTDNTVGTARPPAKLLRRWLGPAGAAATAGIAVAVVIGGWPGVVAAPVVAGVAHRVLSRLEPAAVRRRRLRLTADLPLAVDLLVSCLAAGGPIGAAVSVVAEAVGGPLGQELRRVGSRIDLGGEALVVWADTARDPALAPLARAVVRALDTGAPVVDALVQLAGDLRRERRAAADEAARRVAVQSAGPLGLCFLPAFVLVGIVPTILGAFRNLLG